jgi:catechol 2,3-dioxygenase-like lactoylglutathione lyase family enzyme
VRAASLPAMTIEMGGVTIDCTDPRALAEFWTKALGVHVEHDFGGEYLVLSRTAEGAPNVCLQRVDEPNAGKNRVHIDFRSSEREAEVKRLVGLGATEVAEHTVPGLTWTVLQDPAGNEFCVGAIESWDATGSA